MSNHRWERLKFVNECYRCVICDLRKNVIDGTKANWVYYRAGEFAKASESRPECVKKKTKTVVPNVVYVKVLEKQTLAFIFGGGNFPQKYTVYKGELISKSDKIVTLKLFDNNGSVNDGSVLEFPKTDIIDDENLISPKILGVFGALSTK